MTIVVVEVAKIAAVALEMMQRGVQATKDQATMVRTVKTSYQKMKKIYSMHAPYSSIRLYARFVQTFKL